MYAPHTVTVFNAGRDGELPTATILRGVFLDISKGANVKTSGLENADAATLFVPFSVEAVNAVTGEKQTYREPKVMNWRKIGLGSGQSDRAAQVAQPTASLLREKSMSRESIRPSTALLTTCSGFPAWMYGTLVPKICTTGKWVGGNAQVPHRGQLER